MTERQAPTVRQALDALLAAQETLIGGDFAEPSHENAKRYNEAIADAVAALATAPAGEPRITEVEAANLRLRKIAAHVPGRIYIEAKEKAGYGVTVHAMDSASPKDGEVAALIERLHSALRKEVIQPASWGPDGKATTRECLLCERWWDAAEAERHTTDCLAAACANKHR